MSRASRGDAMHGTAVVTGVADRPHGFLMAFQSRAISTADWQAASYSLAPSPFASDSDRLAR